MTNTTASIDLAQLDKLREEFERAFLSLNGFHTKAEIANEWAPGALSGEMFRAGALARRSLTSGSPAEPVAYLHQVVSGDGEPDQALSFAPDNFPLAGTLGYRSISHVPLSFGCNTESGAIAKKSFDAAILLAGDTINAKNAEIEDLRAQLSASAAAKTEQDDDIRGPLTDAQREECRTLYNNLKHLQCGGIYVADDVIRRAAVFGYMNGRKDFGTPATAAGAGSAQPADGPLINEGTIDQGAQAATTARASGIMTWQERAQFMFGDEWQQVGNLDQYMQAEIVDLRAALARAPLPAALNEIFAAIDEAQRMNRYNESSFEIANRVARLKCLADNYRAAMRANDGAAEGGSQK